MELGNWEIFLKQKGISTLGNFPIALPYSIFSLNAISQFQNSKISPFIPLIWINFDRITNTGKMNRFIGCLLFSMFFLTATSQRVYFVYLQAEAAEPFFVKMNDKVFSSTTSGYLILSKLRDSTYRFSIGFPQNKWPENNFSVAINGKDHGYLLKNFGEKGWGLFDLQTLSVQMPLAAMTRMDKTGKQENRTVSAFTEILSRAADDPSLKEKPIMPKPEEKKMEAIAKVEPKKEELKPVITAATGPMTEPPKATIQEPFIGKKEEEKTIPVELYKPSVITKKSESSTTEGFGLIFVDQYANGTNDTIRLLIPNPKPVLNEVKQEPREEKKFLDILPDSVATEKRQVPEMNQDVVVKKDSTPEIKQVSVNKPEVKNKCGAVAGETDFFKLRKEMAAETGDDNMIREAKKYFKIKCFTTPQLKNLSALFLSDWGKFKFFDAAYPYVADEENFNSLQSEMKDVYYINRFNGMLHH
jgi:Domain of unknown function (DUF4476)